MVFQTKKDQNTPWSLVDRYIRKYFSIIRGSSLECEEVSELLRCSMCEVLGLESTEVNGRLMQLKPAVVSGLSSICDVSCMTKEYKQGILEGCVHGMEMSRKRVNQ